MQTTLRMFTRIGLVCLVVIGLQVTASAQGRGRGAGRSGGGPPVGTGGDRGIGRSTDASAGRRTTDAWNYGLWEEIRLRAPQMFDGAEIGRASCRERV